MLLNICFQICSEMKILGMDGPNVYDKNELLARFQISKSHNSFYYPYTALLNLLQTDDFLTGGNGSDFIHSI